MQLVAFVPDAVGETAVLRSVLPDVYSKEDCVFNVGRVAFLINSLQTGRMWDLKCEPPPNHSRLGVGLGCGTSRWKLI